MSGPRRILSSPIRLSRTALRLPGARRFRHASGGADATEEPEYRPCPAQAEPEIIGDGTLPCGDRIGSRNPPHNPRRSPGSKQEAVAEPVLPSEPEPAPIPEPGTGRNPLPAPELSVVGTSNPGGNTYTDVCRRARSTRRTPRQAITNTSPSLDELKTFIAT